jgi:mono/diheme cytochrome c family protein
MRLVLCILLASTVGTCDQMRHQPRYDSAERSTLFRDGKSLQAPPDGSVPRDGLVAAAALQQRPTMTPALLARGRERYDIYCSPCHDVSGHGHGIVPARGFPTPPDFHQDRLRQVSSAYFVQVITQGHGVMYSYADRVAPADRWAIAAYIRALQLSDSASLAALALDERAKLPAKP